MNYKEEYIKCYKDKTRKYFIENYLSTYNATERKEVPFKLFPRQIELIKAFNEFNNIITIKPRQSGITTITSAFIAAQIVFANTKSPETVLCIGNKLDISQQLLEKIAAFLEQVPRWFWGNEYYSPDPNSPKNSRSIFKARNKQRLELFNGCVVHARSSGTNAARGISAASYVVFDEAAFIQNGVSVYTQAIATTNSVANAKIIIISTPNGKDQLYYQIYSKAVKKENNFHVVEFKWFQDPRYNRNLKWSKKNPETGEIEWQYDTVIDKKGNIKYDEDRWRKLEQNGWKPTSPWYENTCKSFNNDEMKINQELNVSFLGSSDNVVPVETIEMQLKQNVREITDDWNLRDTLVEETWIWKDPIPGHRYICACLPKGEKVLTKDGEKNIEDITYDDKLYGLDGKYIDIVQTMNRYCDNENVYKIKLYNYCSTVRYTGEHPIYVSTNSIQKREYPRVNGKVVNGQRYWEHDFDYVKAKDIPSGSWLKIPNIYKNNILTEKEIQSKWNGDENNNPLLSLDFWWYCGMWLAEGCCVQDKRGNYKIYTSHNTNETDIHCRVKNVIESILHRSPLDGKISNTEHCINISYNYNDLANFLNNTFGKYAHGKYISEWVKFLPEQYKLQLLYGYIQGDGSIVNNKRDGRYIKAASVSLKLLEDFQDILFSIGIVSSVVLSKKSCTRKIKGDKLYICKDIFELSIGKHDSYDLFVKLGIEPNYIDERLRRHPQSYVYLSNDCNDIYIRIADITVEKYTGYVYNFETSSHNYYTNKTICHNCDPSSGAGDDFTAIQVIDVDAIDDNGLPYFEQVLEYNGKVNGNEAGQLLDRYGRIYNDALVVIEAIGGYGDAISLTVMELGYPNLYYDDPSLKNYTNDKMIQTNNYGHESEKQLPGFRTSSLRLQMISNFVNLLKENSFRVRSMRTINELETWVFKNGRPNHMDGQHDDLLTCLAMGLFVMQFYMLKKDKMKAKDACMVNSWVVNNLNTTKSYDTRKLDSTVDISDVRQKYPSPFYSTRTNSENERRRFMAMMMLGGIGKPKKK